MNTITTLGIAAVPEAASQGVIDVLAKAGVKGILNFALRHVTVPRGVKVVAIDLARLPYYVAPGRVVGQRYMVSW